MTNNIDNTSSIFVVYHNNSVEVFYTPANFDNYVTEREGIGQTE